MKTLLLVAGSRSGSDFFQSLLDGHSQVMQFPGLIRTNKELIKVLSSHDPLKISSYFIEQYKHFFDSRVGYSEKVERHNMLGKNKNQYYIVNKEEFKKIFLNLFQKKPIGNSFHNIYQNYHPFIKSKSYSFEAYNYDIKGLNDLEKFLDKF